MIDIEELLARLRDRDAPDGTVGWAHATYPPQKVKDALCNQAAAALEAQAKEIAELEAALKPLAKAWLFPDDLGEKASVIIRCDPDWNEEENDMSREDVIVCRREIRKARAALNGEKGWTNSMRIQQKLIRKNLQNGP
jgi:hypothetical protein